VHKVQSDLANDMDIQLFTAISSNQYQSVLVVTHSALYSQPHRDTLSSIVFSPASRNTVIKMIVIS